MRIFLTLIAFTFINLTYSVEAVKNKSVWYSHLPIVGKYIKYCPDIPVNEYGGKCEAICPKEYTLYKNVDASGVYICTPIDITGQALNIKCKYFNPFCVKKIGDFVKKNPIGKIFRENSYTELAIKLATLDPKLYTDIEKDISLQRQGLPFFAKAFNFLTPIFESVAYFLFELSLFLTASFVLFKKSVVKIFGQKYGFERPFSETFAKAIFVILIFGLPIVPNTEKKDVAPVPLAVDIARLTLLNINDLATYTSQKLVEIYASSLFNGVVDSLNSLENFYKNYNSDILKQIKDLGDKFKTLCIVPYQKVNGEKPKTFIVDDEDLKSFKFGTPNDLQRAFLCRRMQQELDAYSEIYSLNLKQIEKVKEAKNLIEKDNKKIEEEIKKEAKDLTKKAGFISTGILLPEIHFFINEKVSEKVIDTLKSEEVYTYGQSLENKQGLEKKFEGIKKVIPATFIIAIPPFDTLFKVLRDLIKNGIDIAIAPIEAILFATGFSVGGIGGSAITFMLNIIVSYLASLLKSNATIVAFVLTIYLALIVFPILSALGISVAIAIKFLQFWIETILFIWSIPFRVMFMFTAQSEEAVRKFVEELLSLSLMIVLITASPVLAIFIVVGIQLLLFGLFGEVINSLGNYANLIGQILVFLLASLLYLIVHIASVFFGFIIAYKSPDFLLERMRVGISIIGQATERFYEGVSSKISPKF